MPYHPVFVKQFFKFNPIITAFDDHDKTEFAEPGTTPQIAALSYFSKNLCYGSRID